MLKLLVPVDGSQSSQRAIDRVIRQAQSYTGGVDIHLLNVQPPVPSAVASHVGAENLKKHHQEEGMACLKPLLQKLDAAGVKYTQHIAVGDPAETICRFAHEQGVDEILMGTRGLGSTASLLLGSVATKVMHLTDVPVTLVK